MAKTLRLTAIRNSFELRSCVANQADHVELARIDGIGAGRLREIRQQGLAVVA